ncbi:hypothetical protein [Methylobacterium sp. A54F]
MSEPDSADLAASLLAAADAIGRRAPDVPALGTGLLAALQLGLPADSRSAALGLGLAHALVLRALADLAERGLVTVTRRDARTQRCFYAPGPGFAAVVEPAADAVTR